MSQNSITAGGNNASLPVRILSAVFGGLIYYLLVNYFAVDMFGFAQLYAYGAAGVAAITGLVNPKWLLLPIAGVGVPLYKLGKWLSGKAYSKLFRAIINGLIAFVASIAAAYLTASYLGWTLGLTLLLWFPAMCLAFVGTIFIGVPAISLSVENTIIKGLDKLFDATRDWAKKNAKNLFKGIVGIGRVAPGSGSLWDYVEDDKRGAKWPGGFMQFVSLISILALAGGIGWVTYSFLAPFLGGISVPFLGALVPAVLEGWIAIGFAGLIAGTLAIAIFGTVFHLLDEGEVHFAAVSLTIAGVYAAWGVPALFGFGLGVQIAAAVVELFLGLAYVYPGIHALLKTGFIKAIVDGVKYLVKQTYGDSYDIVYGEDHEVKDESKRDFRKFFHQAITFPAALLAGGIAFWAMSFYGVFPLVVVLAVALVTAVVSYLSLGEALDDFPGTVGFGFATSAGAGIGAYFWAPLAASGWLFWTPVAAAVVLTFFIVAPCIYLGLRGVTNKDFAKSAGTKLHDLHKSAFEKARKLTKWWDKNLIDATYEDRSKWSVFFGHTFNVVVLGLGIWQALPLASAWLPFPFWLTVSLLAACGLLVYLILGKILVEWRVTAIGVALSFGLFAHITWELYKLSNDHWWLAAIVASTFASAAFYVAIPAVLWVVKKITDNRFVAGWIGSVLGGIFDFCWGYFEVFWNGFVALCKIVNEWVFKPLFGLLGRLFGAIKEVWDGFFKRA